jgi:hypothetical protein
MPGGLAHFTGSTVTNLPLFSVGILYVLFESLLISTNVSRGDTMEVPAVIRWTLSIRDCHPIVINQCHRRRCGCGCGSLCL